MALGVAVTLWAAGHQRDRIEATRSAAFTKLERDSLRAVTDNLRACERLLRSVQTVFMASDAVSADEFATLYQTLRPRAEFPSLQALAYAERTPFEGGERFITRLVAPRAGNEAVLGLDVATQPDNLVALERSRDSTRWRCRRRSACCNPTRRNHARTASPCACPCSRQVARQPRSRHGGHGCRDRSPPPSACTG